MKRLIFISLYYLSGCLFTGEAHAQHFYIDGGLSAFQQNSTDNEMETGNDFLFQESNNDEQNNTPFLPHATKHNPERIIQLLYPLVFKFCCIQQILFPFGANLSPPLSERVFNTSLYFSR